MPQNITDNPVFTSPIQSVADGDAASGANFLLAPQGLANRTAYLNAIVGPFGTGVTGIRSGTAATMTALTGMVDGQVFLVQSGTTSPITQGVYVYKSASTLTADNAFVYAASGGGQWVHELASLVNANTGIAGIGPIEGAGITAGRLLKTVVPNRMESALAASFTSSFTTTSTSLVDVTGSSVTFTSNTLNDQVLVHYSGMATISAGFFTLQAMVVDNGSNFAQTQTSFTSTTGVTSNTPISGSFLYNCAGGGSLVVKLQAQSNSGANTVTIIPFSLVAVRFRP